MKALKWGRSEVSSKACNVMVWLSIEEKRDRIYKLMQGGRWLGTDSKHFEGFWFYPRKTGNCTKNLGRI